MRSTGATAGTPEDQLMRDFQALPELIWIEVCTDYGRVCEAIRQKGR